MDMYGFSPYMAGMPQPQQNQYMQYMQQQRPQPQQAMPSVMYTPTSKDFASVTLQPPTRQAIIIAQNEPYMCFKNADNMGMVSTTYYKIEPVTEEQISAPQIQYATKQEVATIQDTLNKLINALGGQNNDESINAGNESKSNNATHANLEKR